jgi:leucyl aminopeptidase
MMEQQARDMLTEFPDADLTVTVLQHEDLLAQGLHMLAAVGQGAQVPPRLVAVEYKGDPSAPDCKLALVGKGVTFDTGGLNLKMTGFIEDMHMDMGGSAAVLAGFKGVVGSGLRRNVVCVLALAENAIGKDAVRPHSILTSLKGDTVEVGNTDAEGRLCLGDAMWWVQQQHAPHTVVDVATLTGACVVALGEYAAGLFCNDEELAQALTHASDVTDELVWRMPVLAAHTAELKGAQQQADLRSIGSVGRATRPGAH